MSKSIYEQDLDGLQAKCKRLLDREAEGKTITESVPVPLDTLIHMLEDLGRKV